MPLVDEEDELYYDNSGNGGYSEWVNLSKLDLTELFLKYFAVNFVDKCKVRVKASKGLLIIEEINI